MSAADGPASPVTVVIAIDGSQQAQQAFDCKFAGFIFSYKSPTLTESEWLTDDALTLTAGRDQPDGGRP